VWAERFDCDTEDLFALQDEVTSQIAVALNLELIGAEAAQPTENPDALDYILRGRAALYHHEGSTPERFAEAIRLFEKALALDPDSVDTQALLALALSARVLDQMSDTVSADLDRAEHLIQDVLTSSPRNPLAHFAKGHILRAQRRYEAAIAEYEGAIAVNRNWVVAIAALGLCKFFAGSIEDAIPAQEQAIRLSPRDPRLPNWYWRIGMVHLLQGRTDEALGWLEKARSANPRLAGPHAWLAAAYALKGERDPAVTELANARRLATDGRYSSLARFKAVQSLGAPSNLILAEKTYFEGLRRAGVPEE
jgi:adenylate cyclase